MMRYTIDPSRVAYHPAFDVLYLGYGPHSLDVCDEIVDVDPGITIMRTNGEFSGAEIHGFSRSFGSLPTTIVVDGESPFELYVPAA